MPYKIKNLMFSRRDPTRSGRPGHRSLDLKRGVVLGTRRVKVGRYLILSDEEYMANQDAISGYMTAGAVEVTELYEASQIQIHAPTPQAPPEPEKVAKKAPSPIVIDLMDDAASAEESVVIMDMNTDASEPAKEAEPTPKEKVVHKKAEALLRKPKKGVQDSAVQAKKEAPDSKPAKRARRRKNED